MSKIEPRFQFQFHFRASGRDETEFPVGVIVDQSGQDLFPQKVFTKSLIYSPNSLWLLLFQYKPDFIVLLNLESGASYNLGFYDDPPQSYWVGPQHLKWRHDGINNIREVSDLVDSVGASFCRFSVECEHTAGGEWTHPIHFIDQQSFAKFASENEALLEPGRNSSIWWNQSDFLFRSIQIGLDTIQSNEPWNFYHILPGNFVQIVPQNQNQTYVCRLDDLKAYYRLKKP